MLFALKLELFEYDTIKKSDNSKYKSLIRKAQSLYEVLKYCEIIEYENQNKDRQETKKLDTVVKELKSSFSSSKRQT